MFILAAVALVGIAGIGLLNALPPAEVVKNYYEVSAEYFFKVADGAIYLNTHEVQTAGNPEIHRVVFPSGESLFETGVRALQNKYPDSEKYAVCLTVYGPKVICWVYSSADLADFFSGRMSERDFQMRLLRAAPNSQISGQTTIKFLLEETPGAQGYYAIR